MRLTIRTMLAYMDGLLEQEDAEDIGKKIDQSEYATNLLHRTRDVMRRLRLAAPSLTGRGQAPDANTVAEYLDNTLHDQQVADFEKVCLDSDIHLAEVASCHQILTLVLGEPAEIDPDSRQRMYQVPELAAGGQQDVGGDSVGDRTTGQRPSLPPTEPDSPKSRRRPTVPEYLRESPKRRRFLPVAAAVVLAACFAVMVLIALGQFEPGTPLGNLLARAGFGNAGDEGAGPAAPDTLPPESPPTDAAPPDQPAEQPGLDLPPEPEPPQERTDSPPEPQPELEPEPELAPDDEPEPTPVLEPGPQPEPEPAHEPEPEPESKDTSSPPQPVGRFMSEKQVLLRFDSQSASWRRVPAKGILFPHGRLIALPTYRPEITVGAGINVQLLDGTQIELLPGDQQNPAGLKVDYGRLFIVPPAEDGTRLRLVFGDRTGVVTFGDAESILALEVTPVRFPGTNPETEPAVVVADLYAKTGHVVWEEGAEEKTVRIVAQTCLVLDYRPTRDPVAVEEFPKWITSEVVGVLDRRASGTLEQSLQLDRSAGLGLMELADHRKREIRWLATRCLGYIGNFDPMVAVLDDSSRKLDWPDYIEKLQAALARGPQVAARVRQALEKQHVQEATELYRMLWGYSQQDLEDGQDATLVGYLESETLALRVLSCWNLKQITGLGLYYRPEEPAAKRKTPVRNWNERLKAGQIRFKPPGEGREGREKGEREKGEN